MRLPLPTTFTTRAVTTVVKVALRSVVPAPAYLLVVAVVGLEELPLPIPKEPRTPNKVGELKLLLPARLVLTSALALAVVASLILTVTRSLILEARRSAIRGRSRQRLPSLSGGPAGASSTSGIAGFFTRFSSWRLGMEQATPTRSRAIGSNFQAPRRE